MVDCALCNRMCLRCPREKSLFINIDLKFSLSIPYDRSVMHLATNAEKCINVMQVNKKHSERKEPKLKYIKIEIYIFGEI